MSQDLGTAASPVLPGFAVWPVVGWDALFSRFMRLTVKLKRSPCERHCAQSSLKMCRYYDYFPFADRKDERLNNQSRVTQLARYRVGI